MRDNTSCKNKVHGILYKPPVTCKSMAYGIEMEPFARTYFEQLFQIHVELCGLFIDREYPFLAASPDGLVGQDIILEIKCPYAAKDTTSALEAVEQNLLPYCSVKESMISLKKDHTYYFQVIGQVEQIFLMWIFGIKGWLKNYNYFI
ncbi:uncharacterized protein LOC126554107 [Aphis gossypii]|uniref:uncharacterized protein LOC126554107 n=1 Tax=Aphis gossypii TaxID=80765 RepID=UPI0021595B33|nr:uncharacterized protein LOC126554107 [Aphis gossypii]